MLNNERFWSKVDIKGPDECWPWKASIHKTGKYGRFKYANKLVAAHRMAYSLFYNVPLELLRIIMHTCDNRPCCNPKHLLEGTTSDNNKDCINKGRFKFETSCSIRNSAAKLTEEQVKEIRIQRSKGNTLRDIAKEFSVNWIYVLLITDGNSLEC